MNILSCRKNFKLCLTIELYNHNVFFHESLLKAFHSPLSASSTEPGPSEEPTLLLMLLEDGPIYGVKEILDSRCHEGGLKYLVD